MRLLLTSSSFLLYRNKLHIDQIDLATDSNWSSSPQPRRSTTQIPSSPKLLHSPTIGNTRSFSAAHSAYSAPTTVRFNGTSGAGGSTTVNKIRKRKKMADTEKEEAINLVSFKVKYLVYHT